VRALVDNRTCPFIRSVNGIENDFGRRMDTKLDDNSETLLHSTGPLRETLDSKERRFSYVENCQGNSRVESSD